MITSAGLEDVGYTWRKWGGIWGGPKDPVHFEYPGFKPPADSPDVDVALKACDFLSVCTPPSGVNPERKSHAFRATSTSGLSAGGLNPGYSKCTGALGRADFTPHSRHV